MGSVEASSSSSTTTTLLAPGFRFHPTDEELVAYYLKKKVFGKGKGKSSSSPSNFCISETDIYKVEPWDLPGLSKLKTRDLEWYFFSSLDKKYGNGSKTNRATLEGYWKTTGRDRPVKHKDQIVGMKKTLVYHLGRAPHGKRSNWVMHEYRLVDEVLNKSGYSLEGMGYVLCRIFQKSGTGPKNAAQYGAPLEEREWDINDIDEALVPQEVSFEDPFVDEDAFTESKDLEQFGLEVPQNIPVPVNACHEDANAYLEGSENVVASEETDLAVENTCENILQTEYNCDFEALDDQKYFKFPVPVGTNGDIVKNEHLSLPVDVTDGETVQGVCSEPMLDTIGAVLDDSLYSHSFDFLDTAAEDSLDFGSLGQIFDDDIDIGEYLNFDTAPALTDSDAGSFSTDEILDNALWQTAASNQQLRGPCSDGTASSSEEVFKVSQATKPKLDLQYSFLDPANCFLGSIPAPHAFAAEPPTKEMAARLSQQSSSSIHVRAGMIRIRDTPVEHSRLQWSFDKSGNVNILLAFDLPQDASQPGLYSLSNMLSRKMASTFHSWLHSLFCILFVAMSYKLSSSCIFVEQ